MVLLDNVGKIRVRREIYEQAQALEKEATERHDPGAEIGVAEARWDDCRISGDRAGSVYWHDVWAYLMEVACTDRTEIEFIED